MHVSVEEAAQAIRDGKTLLVLSDKKIRQGFLPANALMATGAVHHYLINVGFVRMPTLLLKRRWHVIRINLRLFLVLVRLRFIHTLLMT